MKILKGMAANGGLVRGVACLYTEKAAETVPHYAIDSNRIPAEIERLDAALEKAKGTMKEMIGVSKDHLDNRASEIFNAHLMMLDDPVLYQKIKDLIKAKGINAEHAVDDAFDEYIKSYEVSGLHFAELAHDTADVKNRILFSFSGLTGRFQCQAGERHAVVITSKRLSPSMILSIPRENILAFVTEEGGFTTHATILARSFGVPVIFGIAVEEHINCGDKVIIDGSHGKVIVEPDEKTNNEYKKKIDDHKKKMAVCEVRKEEPSQTKKGLRVSLKANISIPGEMELLKGLHYDGIGLLRTEFLFVNKELPPSEDEQYNMYARILEDSGTKDVAIRLLDIGGDKLPSFLTLPAQDNPDLGIRGARALDFFYDLYLTQVKAILRASLDGNIKILLPMVSDLGDVHTFRALIDKAKSLLRGEKKKFKKDIEIGIMIETPSAALMADTLLKEVDFANIGSNDLLQYTLAASRGNVAVERRYHILHPALVRLMEDIVKAGKRYDKEICLCGEIASFDEYYPFFLSLGLRSFSVAASRLDEIKCELMHQIKPADSMAERFYKAVTKDDIDRIFEQ